MRTGYAVASSSIPKAPGLRKADALALMHPVPLSDPERPRLEMGDHAELLIAVVDDDVVARISPVSPTRVEAPMKSLRESCIGEPYRECPRGERNGDRRSPSAGYPHHQFG
jgi:hypothetical protein